MELTNPTVQLTVTSEESFLLQWLSLVVDDAEIPNEEPEHFRVLFSYENLKIVVNGICQIASIFSSIPSDGTRSLSSYIAVTMSDI